MNTYLGIAYVAINLTTFLLYAYDKTAARSSLWRIPERKLLGISMAGGCFGGLLAMSLTRHKIRKLRFIVTNLAACAVHAAIILLAAYL